MKVLGPYRNNCNRLFVRIGENGSYKTKSYSRYLMEQKLGRPLEPKEDVHHIDGNPENNNFDNLEIKLHGEHQREHSLKLSTTIVKICCECGKEFVLTKEQRKKYSQGRLKRFFCSRRCSGICGRKEQLMRNCHVECS